MANLFRLSQFEEYQLWLDGLAAHHRHCGIPFGTQTAVLLNRDFKEDVRTALQIVEDLIAMTQRIVASELLQIREVDPAALANPGRDLRKQFKQYKNYARGIDDLVIFWDFLENYRTLSLSMLRLPTVSRPEFKAISYMFTEQMNRFNRSESSTYLRKKFYDWQFKQVLERDIVKNVNLQGSREIIERLFLDFFTLLCMVHYMRDEMRRRFPFRKLMSLFMHLNFSCRKFLKLLEDSRKYLSQSYPEVAENLLDISMALKMEMRRVFSGELRDLESQKKIDVVYGQMQNALGMMLNAFQESFINLAHILNPSFNEFEIFEELGRKHRESTALLNGLNEIYKAVSTDSQGPVNEPKYQEVKQTLDHFRNTAMRFLFFKDWSTFEQFSDELEKATPEERVFVLHRLAVYLSTLIGEVQKRTVLTKVIQDTRTPSQQKG
ncbi:MAG: hypothetical protein EHM23_17590 [Acidobacteria bacterium]|nr:MAG: hypothetical protein EHM23_17590 [Acidobacteriota bacterium]